MAENEIKIYVKGTLILNNCDVRALYAEGAHPNHGAPAQVQPDHQTAQSGHVQADSVAAQSGHVQSGHVQAVDEAAESGRVQADSVAAQSGHVQADGKAAQSGHDKAAQSGHVRADGAAGPSGLEIPRPSVQLSENAGEQRIKKGDVGRELMKTKASITKASMLIDRARYLVAKLDYEGATELLDDPAIISSDDIAGKTLLVESYLMLGRRAKAGTIFKALNVQVTSQMNASDVMEYAIYLAANFAYTRAMILFPLACGMFPANASSPDNAVNKVQEGMEQMFLSITALINAGYRSRANVEYGIELMGHIYGILESIKGASPGLKALAQAWVLHKTGLIYGRSEEHEKSLKPWHDGLKLLEQLFQGNESKLKVYGFLVNNVGVCYFNLKNFTEAENYYLRALIAYEKATDFPNENEKQDKIKNATKDLDDTRKKLAEKAETDNSSSSPSERKYRKLN